MSANGISSLGTKQARQVKKLDIAQGKRQGYVVDIAGNIGVILDQSKPYFRKLNTYDILRLPTQYTGNNITNNPGQLIQGRPWLLGAVENPTTIEETVTQETLVALQIWYDSGDTTTFVPSATDENQITQWTDKSNFAHNANPAGGGAKPSYENTILQPVNTGYGYLEFDGNDQLTVNPFTTLQNQSGFTVFVVANFLNTTGIHYLTETNQNDLRINSNNTTIEVGMNGVVGTVATEADTNWNIHSLIFDGTQTTNADKLKYRKNSIDKTLTFTGTVPTSTSASNTHFAIGEDYAMTPNTGLVGYIGEIILFSKALTTTEYQNVENYLSNKWGI